MDEDALGAVVVDGAPVRCLGLAWGAAVGGADAPRLAPGAAEEQHDLLAAQPAAARIVPAGRWSG